jgi:hypothetical protein
MLTTPIDAAVLIVLLSLPLHWLVLRHFDRLDDPAYMRRQGIVVERESALEARAAAMGEYLGQPIAEAVVFKGMRYRFDHVLDRRSRERIAPGQLFLEPGLVYVLESALFPKRQAD